MRDVTLPINRYSYREAGLSLVELMIAMVLGLLLTLGVVQIFLSTSQTSRLTESMARLQENARFAGEFLKTEVQEAGGNGCLLGGGILDDLRVAQLEPDVSGIVGWEYNGTAPGNTFPIDASADANAGSWTTADPAHALAGILPLNGVVTGGNMVAGSDILVVQGAFLADLNGNVVTGTGGNQIGLSGPSGLPAGTVIDVISPSCDTAVRFVKGNNENAVAIAVDGATNVPAANINRPWILPPIDIYVFRSVAFFIGLNPAGEPGLYRLFLDRPGLDPEELVDGVESMQIMYGVGGTRRSVNNYVTANAIPGGDWDSVRSVKVSLVFRSDDRVADAPLEQRFNLLGTELVGETDRRMRLVTSATISLRNRLE